MIGIYKFTNKITGKSYIGQSRNIHKRYITHKNKHINSKDEDTYFHSILRKYGFENFDFEVIEECLVDELNDKEIFYISKFNSLYPNGYNLTPGGSSPHVNALRNIDEVNEIKQYLKNTNMTNEEIGNIFRVSDQTISDINNGRIWFCDNEVYPIRQPIYHRVDEEEYLKRTTCVQCGKPIQYGKKNRMCLDCYKKNKSQHIPNKETLYDLLIKNTFVEVGRKFGVSYSTIRKWCKKYNIPYYSSYYREQELLQN